MGGKMPVKTGSGSAPAYPGRKIVPVSASAIEMLLKIVASALLAPALGYFGICITEPIIWLVCAAVVAVDYFIFVRKSAAK